MIFLEMLFIFVALVALCNQRQIIGKSAFAMALGLTLFLNCLISGADIRAELWSNMTFQVGEVAVYLPVLAAFLMFYAVSGVLATQRLLCGIVIAYFIYIYFGQIVRLQCHWAGFSLFAGINGTSLDSLLSAGRTNVNITAVGHFLEFLTVPVIYSKAFRSGQRRWSAVLAALFCAQAVGMLPELLIAMSSGEIPTIFNGNFYARSIASIVIGTLLALYLDKLETETAEAKTGTWDFIFAFFGSYSRAQQLETDLRETETNYRHIFRHTADAIIVLTESGRVYDANISAEKLFSIRKNDTVIGENILNKIDFLPPDKPDLTSIGNEPVYFRCRINPDTPGERILAASCSAIRVKERQLTILIGRDITEELRLAEEKAALTEHLNHAQRLESLGILAGGIAHDFNNYIHAILGHVDVATMLDAGDPESLNTHLKKIGSIAEHAGKLTGQMLGFARKGKYNVVEVELPELFENCRTLLNPKKIGAIDFQISIPATEKWTIKADLLQMQQVLMNMLLNSVDALNAVTDREQKLTLSVCSAAESQLEFDPPQEFADAGIDDYLCINIRDNGCGMSENTANKIFEPFFTTKPVGVGTGMGLSMAYGIIANHKGWLQLKTVPGEGTLFCIYLPRSR